MTPAPAPAAIIEFGHFKLLRDRRELLVDGRPIELGGRAFDMLAALIDAHGTVVGKDELMSRVWPGRIVEENSLQAQVSVLRRALGGDRDLIRTVAGRGYQFTGEIHVPPAAAPPHVASNVPEPVSELIGREAVLEQIVGFVEAHRLVTLTGTGGIGKTRLGLATARQLVTRFADGAWVAELGPLSDPELVPITVANALGLPRGTAAATPQRVAAALGAKHLLLVLDNCEHLIEAVARMAEALLHTSPTVRVLVTSREALRAEGEYVFRVPPLDVPAEVSLDPEDILRHGAVQLFVARARAAEPQFVPSLELASIKAGICRRLDGIPLAIELAAARVASFGVEGIAARLDDRFRLLTGGQRTALPRHQTLRATLDWSYELLSAQERMVLRRLAVFPAGFALEAASAVAASADIPAADVVDHVVNLINKSLVAADLGGAVAYYRLLETTRAYAREKLTESGEFEEVARHHAEYHRDLMERAEAEWETRSSAEWLATYGRRIDDVRAALAWAFSPGGDTAIGIALAIAAVPLCYQLSLMDECRARVEQGLASIGAGPSRDVRREMQLFAALGGTLLYTVGPGQKMKDAWTKVLEIAEAIDDVDYQLRALWGLWVAGITSGEHQVALALARRFSTLAGKTSDPADSLVGDRLIGISLNFLGDQPGARHHIERVLDGHAAPMRRSHTIRFQYDQRVAARAFLARILWLQGSPDQAMREAQSSVDDARAIGHALSLCHALAQAGCPVALFAGDTTAAHRFVTMLLDHSAKYGLDIWHALGRCFHGVVMIERGDLDAGLQLLSAQVDQFRKIRFAMFYGVFVGALANGLAKAAQAVQGLAAIDEALAACEHYEEGWCRPELLRIKGELILLQNAPAAAAAAETHFLDALDWARRQGALSWELRCATSLARLWNERGRKREAHALLAPVLGRFTEGFGTADLAKARLILDVIQ